MRVTVIGAGYVGLVAACGLAISGHEVTCVEKDPARLGRLREGKVPFREEGLDELLHNSVGELHSVASPLRKKIS